MHIRRTEASVQVTTPAKVNLSLEVLGKRPDGFHEIETIITAVTAYDTLTFTSTEASAIELECRWSCGSAAIRASQARQTGQREERPADILPSGPENLVWRAAELVRKASGINRGATISLVKRIPVAAGLGGASSDAAATLVAANIAWHLNWPRQQLAELGAQLGSDVPFFLTRGAAICRGRGENIEIFTSPLLHFVIVRPPVGLQTAAVYRAWQAKGAAPSAALLLMGLKLGNVSAVSRALANGLQQPAAGLTPWIDRLLSELGKLDLSGQQMTGSGSSCFALCRSARHARRAAARLRARNVGTAFAATSAIAG